MKTIFWDLVIWPSNSKSSQVTIPPNFCETPSKCFWDISKVTSYLHPRSIFYKLAKSLLKKFRHCCCKFLLVSYGCVASTVGYTSPRIPGGTASFSLFCANPFRSVHSTRMHSGICPYTVCICWEVAAWAIITFCVIHYNTTKISDTHRGAFETFAPSAAPAPECIRGRQRSLASLTLSHCQYEVISFKGPIQCPFYHKLIWFLGVLMKCL